MHAARRGLARKFPENRATVRPFSGAGTLALLCWAGIPFAGGQPPSAPPPAEVRPPPVGLVSPEVHADHSVTFRLRAPWAQAVLLARETAPSLPMHKTGGGVWEATTGPLKPDYYGYSFLVDGVSFVDPNNSLVKPSLQNVASLVHVPGPPALSWEVGPVPRGEIQQHFFHSQVVGDDRDYFVYTPPGYAPAGGRATPSCISCTDIRTTPAPGPRWVWPRSFWTT